MVESLQGELKKTIAKRIDYLSSLKETLKEAELAAEKKAAESAKLAKEATEKKAAKSIINSPETHNAQEVIDKLYDDSLNGDERKAIYEKLRSKRKPGVDDSRYLLKGEANSLNQGECLQAISRYTSMGYEKVNAYLREGADGIPEEFIAETRKEIELIYSGISRLPRYNPVEPYLSRYIRLVDPQKPIKKMDKASVQELLEKAYPDGGEITEPSFLSVSPSMEGTASFSDKSASDHSVKFVIRARESSVARDITQYNTSGELEVLYPPGMRFKVVKKYIHSFDQAIHSPLEKVERLEKDYKIPRFNDLWVVELEEI